MPDLHRDAVVVDAHNDLILLVARKRAAGETRYFREHVLPALREGGVDVQVVPIYMEAEYAAEGALRRTLQLIEYVHAEADANRDAVALCLTGAEVNRAVREGKVALILALEGCDGIGRQVDLFATMFRLGVRVASFTHFGRTALADGSGEDAAGSRLTESGVAAVREMERLGILVDVSHLSAGGTRHVLEIATRPVIATHSSARTLCDHHRNLTDDQMRGIAATGGVIGVNFFPAFVDPEHHTIGRLVDHVQHIAAVAGIDHVGIGPDFIKEYYDDLYPQHASYKVHGLDGKAVIEGLTGPRDLPALTAALRRRGLSETDVRKILGENFLRVFRTGLGVPAGEGR